MLKNTIIIMIICVGILMFDPPLGVHAGPGNKLPHVYYVPYVAVKTGHWTGVSVRNMNPAQPARVVLELFETDGTRVALEEKTLPPRNQASFAAGKDMEQSGWLKISSNQHLSGLFFQGIAGHWNLLVSPPLISGLSTNLYFPHAGHDDKLDTEVFICNPNPTPNPVLLEFEDAAGQILFSKTWIIPANGSGQFDMKELVQQTIQSRGSLIITADQGIAAFAMLSNLKSGGMSYTVIPAMNTME